MEKSELKNLLLRQFKLYPEMRARDVVKLLYQSEFAGGHLIENKTQSLDRLKEECASLKQSLVAEEAFEDIGNSLCRLNLRALKRLGIEPETANRFFTETANSVRGGTEGFERKLSALLDLCRDGELLFEPEKVETYIRTLKDKGYPPVSHSEEYKSAYAPAYRVVNAAYRDYIEVFGTIDSLIKSKDKVNVAIDGSCGAGKSALASLISGVYDCNIFHMDDFFLRQEQRTEQRLKETGGNVDYERFAAEIVEGINSGGEFSYRKYGCKAKTLGDLISIKPKRLNVIEGSYSMHPSLIGFYDLKIFLQIAAGEQSARILKRNGPKVHQRFIKEWIPMENMYFEKMMIKEKADLVFG
jgi:uridine kinase